MATARVAAQAVFGTVEQAAGTITDVFSTVSTGAKMLNDFVTDAREKQLMNIKLSKVGYQDMLLVTKTTEIHQSRQALKDYISGDPAKEQECQIIMDQLKAALA